MSADGNTSNAPGRISGSNHNPPNGSTAITEIDTGTAPYVSASASTFGPQGLQGVAQTVLIYYFQINGAEGSISTNIASSGNVWTQGSSSAAASLELFDANEDLVFQQVAQLPSGNASFALNENYSLQANTLYKVYINTTVVVSADLSGSSGGASVDPTITVNNPNYQIEFSSSVTPEPGSLSLIAMCGAAMLRRRRVRA